MNPEIKKKWCEALRSGDYKQCCSGQLRDNKSYCCLGVLCDIYSKETGTEWEDMEYLTGCFGLPEQVQQWAGLPVSLNTVIGGSSLVGLNDYRRWSFEQIADFIEENG